MSGELGGVPPPVDRCWCWARWRPSPGFLGRLAFAVAVCYSVYVCCACVRFFACTRMLIVLVLLLLCERVARILGGARCEASAVQDFCCVLFFSFFLPPFKGDFEGVTMSKRHKMSRGRSGRVFTKTARGSHVKNGLFGAVLRGGIRL